MIVVSPMLGPVVALVAWSLVMMAWMYATRLPAMRRKGIFLKGRVGTRPGALDGVVEDHVQWKAHNYNHLMEQPTLFYAVSLAFAVMDRDGGIHGAPLVLAWAYIACRVAHSLVHATTNVILVRFTLFIAGSLCLAGLTILAAAHLIH
jgi:hypothetical protein